MGRRLTLEAALAQVLARLDAGRPVDLAWLRRTYPHHWEELHQSLVLMSWLEPEPVAEERASVAGWRLLEQLGRGGAGTTWRATRDDGESDVCVKILRPESAARRSTLSRFVREARLGLDIRHPNVVRVLEADTCEWAGRRTAYLALELVEGETLRDRLRRAGSLSRAEVRDLGVGLARGLDAIHAADALHLDLKPENVLLDGEGRPRIADLGVAFADDETAHAPGFAGTVRYAAPEQFTGTRVGLDARTDLFSLGAVLYEALHGAPYRSGGRDQVLSQAVACGETTETEADGALERLIHTLLSAAPESRPTSAADVASALQSLDPEDRGGSTSGRDAVLEVERRTPLVGRDRELELLLRDLDEPVVRLVRAAGGVGKSRLLAELVARVRERGTQVVRLAGDDEDGPRRALELTGADTTPKLVVVEDLHRAEHHLGAWSTALRALRAAGVGCCATLRPLTDPEWLAGALEVDDFRLLDLTPLGPEAARELFRAVAGTDVPDTGSLSSSGGLPLAIVLAAERAGTSRGSLESLTRAASRDDVTVPHSVLRSVHAALARMTPADAALVEAAAVTGLVPDLSLVGRLVEQPEERVTVELTRIAESGRVLVAHPDGPRFRHALVHDAVAALTPRETLRSLHRRAAGELAPTDDEPPTGELAVRVVHHRLVAEDADDLGPLAWTACDHLLRRGRFVELHCLAERALRQDAVRDGSRGSQLLLFHALASQALGMQEVALRSAEAALDHTADASPRDRLMCLHTAVGVITALDPGPRARALIEEGLRLAEADGSPAGRAGILRHAIEHAIESGDLPNARSHMDAFAQLIDGLEARGIYGILLLHLRAKLLARLGDHEEQLEALREAIRLAEEAGQGQAATGFRNRLPACLMQLGRAADAAAAIRRTLPEARRSGRGRDVVYQLRIQGYLLMWCGSSADARRNFAVAMRLYERLGMSGALAETLAVVAHLESRLGDPVLGGQAARRALRTLREISEAGARPQILQTLALSTLLRGRTATTARLARLALRADRLLDDAPCRLACEVLVALATGDLAEARVALRQDGDRLRGYDAVELTHLLALRSDAAEDATLARRRVRRFLDACDDEQRRVASSHSPEARAWLDSPGSTA